jgi:P-type Ca2+ transporter type 2C
MKGQLPGLTSGQAADALKKWGPNRIEDPNRVTVAEIILRQIKNNFIIYLLLAAAIISFFIGEPVTGYTVIGVILMVIGVSFFQEYRAEKAIAALREMITPVSTVVRDGREREVATETLVPGDIVVLRTGEKIPADGKLLISHDLLVNEALVTGEAEGLTKKAEDPVLAGTFVIGGKGVLTVTHTGMNTRFGQIVNLISRSEKELPLLAKVNNIARYMVVAAMVISAATGLLMLSRAGAVNFVTLSRALIVTIALMVSAFPEGLPVVLVTSLAVGASRMARNNAIVNRMSIIETLGETTVICADKTGTLTSGVMTVEKIISEDPRLLLTAAVLCNDSRPDFGSPTEMALLAAGAKEKIYPEDLAFELTEEIPFSSERKFMEVRGRLNGENRVFLKGAPEVILAKCHLAAAGKEKILRINRELTGAAYRTIAVAEGTRFLGLVALSDPPRAEVRAALEICRQAGIAVKMITGDQRATALAVAAKIGLTGKILDGADLDKMTDEELEKVVRDVTIFARVRPEHKLRIVRALKNLGEVVTMTGDGVNDAPALKEAQIGVAMGQSGTDVSRSVADLTLKDNNFATIVMAVTEGRTVFNNMRKFVSYQLSCNYAELMILFFGVLLAPAFGWQAPILLALQILFMNLVTDDFPAITFAFNKSSRDVMQEGPRRRPELISRPLLGATLLAGGLMTGLTLGSFAWSFNVLGQETVVARTTALLTLILLEIINAFNFRSFRFSTLFRSPLSNIYLFWAAVGSLLLAMGIIYTPLRAAFDTAPLGPANWGIALISSLAFILIFDALKAINNRKRYFNFS